MPRLRDAAVLIEPANRFEMSAEFRVRMLHDLGVLIAHHRFKNDLPIFQLRFRLF
jgi:hypothetical protein